MAGELRHHPTSGQLVYSPATGQLVYNCASSGPCPCFSGEQPSASVAISGSCLPEDWCDGMALLPGSLAFCRSEQLWGDHRCCWTWVTRFDIVSLFEGYGEPYESYPYCWMDLMLWVYYENGSWRGRLLICSVGVMPYHDPCLDYPFICAGDDFFVETSNSLACVNGVITGTISMSGQNTGMGAFDAAGYTATVTLG